MAVTVAVPPAHMVELLTAAVGGVVIVTVPEAEALEQTGMPVVLTTTL